MYVIYVFVKCFLIKCAHIFPPNKHEPQSDPHKTLMSSVGTQTTERTILAAVMYFIYVFIYLLVIQNIQTAGGWQT